MLKRRGAITALYGSIAFILEIFEIVECSEKWRSLRHDLISRYSYGEKFSLILWRSSWC